MRRLPTILVIGSHAISTTSPDWFLVVAMTVRPPSPGLRVAGQQRVALLAPLRLLVDRVHRDAAQPADHRAVQRAGARGHLAARRLVHEGHELVGEAGHRAGDADAADVGTAPDAVDPAPFRHVALHDRAPAAELDQALRGAVTGGELTLLVVPGTVAALMHRGPEQPARPQRLVQRDHGGLAGDLVEQVHEGLGHVVRVHRAARHAD